jgi:hypothetical protein
MRPPCASWPSPGCWPRATCPANAKAIRYAATATDTGRKSGHSLGQAVDGSFTDDA